jgi:leucyl aminopeptidase (aminopeptidase T)
MLMSCGVAVGLWIGGCQEARTPQTTSTSALPAPAPAADTATRKAPTDLEQLAERLVNQSAGIKEGELVVVSGGVQDLELLENIAVHARKVGAFPQVVLDSDRMAKRLFFDVPEKFDAQADALGLTLAANFNALIVVDSNLDETVFAGADPKRQAARAKAGQPVLEAFLKHKTRLIEVGNGLYPSAWRAKRFGMTEDELMKTFWDGVNIDYSSLSARAEQVKSVLAGGSEIHITDSNGTDLRVRVQGRPVHASDGIISSDEAQKGGAGLNVFLPAGEVYVTPVASTAAGKVVRPREYFQGREIQNLTLTFADGRLTSITGSGPGFEPLKARYDAAGEGKDLFAVIDLGINPNVKLPASSAVGTWVPAGTVTVGMGSNTWAGGNNKSTFAYYVSLPGTTVTLDGKPIVENGHLRI